MHGLHHRGRIIAGCAALLLAGMPAGLLAAPDGAPVVAQAAQSNGTISGTVKTPNGFVVAGARVAVSGPIQGSTLTDAGGAFTIAVPPGIYTVTVTRNGYTLSSLADIAVVSGATQPLTVTLSQADLSSIRTIGSVTATGRGATGAINVGASTTSFIGRQAFSNIANPQINDVLDRVPDVTIQRMGSQQDTSIVVGGAQPYETQVLFDGHPLALGQYGVWVSTYFPSYLIGGVETQAGPGNTTPFANIAVGGTANLVSPGFTKATTAELVQGVDTFQSQYTTFLSSGSMGRFSYVVGAGTAGNNGQYYGATHCAVSPDNYGGPAPGVAGDNAPGNVGIVQFCGDMSGSLFTRGTVLKAKYDLSSATSIDATYVGAWGGYSPQGAAWGNYIGPTTIESCWVTNPTICTAPEHSNLVGQTLPGYVWYPGSTIYNNQGLFSAQFRTSIGNNTLLVRPYTGAIEPEVILGQGEGAYAAFYGPAPGSPNYTPPTYPNGAAIPSTFQPYFGSSQGTPFEQTCGVTGPTVFTQLQSPQGTSVVTKSGQQECFQFPYSTFERDTLYGSTFSFIHPFGDNTLNFTYDFHGQGTFAYLNALSPLTTTVPQSGTRYSTFSLTGELHPVHNLGINLGLYDTRWTVAGVQAVVDPATGLALQNADGSYQLTGLSRSVSRFDPHVAFVLRPSNDLALRAAYGTSATFPFLGQISGTPSYQPFASSAPQYSGGVLTYKSPNLSPEVSVEFSAGVDKRLNSNSVLSLDLQSTTVHNVFEYIYTSVPVNGLLEGTTIPSNVARLRSKTATLKYRYAPATGVGFNLAAQATSAMVDGIPPSAYQPPSDPGSFPVNNVQICGNGLVTPGIATCIPYLKGYAQLTYTLHDGTFFALGADYQGKNNPYYQPPFTLVDLTIRRPVTKSLEILVSAQNLLNSNAFEALPEPGAGQTLVAASNAGQINYASTLITAPPRTVRVQLRLHTGR